MSMSPEPMSLGSPTQSPANSSQAAGPQPYLPQFLLGDINSSLNSPLLNHHRAQTPQQQQQQMLFHHHQQQYGSSGSSQRYYGGSNSPPRGSHPSLSSGPGAPANFLLPHHHHHHHLLQQGGSGAPSSLARTYSVNAYDYGAGRSSTSGGGMIEKSEPNIGGGGYGTITSAATYSPLHPPSTPSQAPPGAPPINRLVDIMNTKSSSNTPLGSNSVLEANLSPYMPNSSHSQTRLNSPPSPGSQFDSMYQQPGESQQFSTADDTWVTIFGHPPSATSYVLQEFATYGQIVRYVPPSHTEQGNWLHVKYQTRMQAQKALSKNGKILGGQFMVGVMPCMDRKVMSGVTASTTLNLTNNNSLAPPTLNEENTEPATTNKPPSLPVRGGFPSGARLDRTQSLRAGVRPLAQLNRQAAIHDDSSIDPNAAKLPKKNTNVISKAMEFMFGW